MSDRRILPDGTYGRHDVGYPRSALGILERCIADGATVGLNWHGEQFDQFPEQRTEWPTGNLHPKEHTRHVVRTDDADALPDSQSLPALAEETPTEQLSARPSIAWEGRLWQREGSGWRIEGPGERE